MAKAKSDYYTNIVSSNAKNSCQLWNYLNEIVHRAPVPTLLIHVSTKSLCDSFSSHFKIKIRSHIESKCMNNVLQSAYKQFHSTETALLKLQNDVSLNMDKGKVTALTLLN